MHAETTAKDVLLFVLNMPVPASPLPQNFKQVLEKLVLMKLFLGKKNIHKSSSCHKLSLSSNVAITKVHFYLTSSNRWQCMGIGFRDRDNSNTRSQLRLTLIVYFIFQFIDNMNANKSVQLKTHDLNKFFFSHCEIFLQQHHQHSVFRALFQSDPRDIGIIAIPCNDRQIGVSGSQADIYSWSELHGKHSMIFLHSFLYLIKNPEES